jgi:type II secretory pathway component PulF
MNDVTLEQIMALNEELSALAAAGVPVDLGDSRTTLQNTLSRINSSLARYVGQGQPMTAALADGPELPDRYQNAMLTGLETNRPELVLEGVTRQPTAYDDLRRTVSYALVQPLILLALAYVGFIVLCLTFAPMVEDVYEQIRQQPNSGARLLAICREWMPVWVPLVPVGMLFAVVAWRWRPSFSKPWLLGSSRYFTTINCATFAEQAADLISANVPVPESLRLAAKSTDDAGLISAVESIVAADQKAEPLSTVEYQNLRSLPPFLRWVLVSNLDKDSLGQMLRFAGETYRQSVDRQAALWRVLMPAFAGALLGGLIVFAFALSMFGTYVALLYDLAYAD